MQRYLMLLLGVLLLTGVPVMAGEIEPGVKLDRWGVTVDEKLDHGNADEKKKDTDKTEAPAVKKEVEGDSGDKHREETDGKSESVSQTPQSDAPPTHAVKPKQAEGAAGGPAQQPLKPMPEDRPYIMQQEPIAKSGRQAAPKGPPVKYRDESQQRLCDQYMEQMEDSYLKARYYSVSGDACSTTKFASQFLEGMTKCKADCPEGTLLYNGYDAEFIRNMSRLKELGRVRCLQGGK